MPVEIWAKIAGAAADGRGAAIKTGVRGACENVRSAIIKGHCYLLISAQIRIPNVYRLVDVPVPA